MAIKNDCWVSINLNELVAIRSSFLEEELTEDEIDQVANDLRIRMTYDSLYEQTDQAIWEFTDSDCLERPRYGTIETGVIPKPEFELVKLKSYCWEIDVPRRIK